jgi:NAD+ synthase
MDYKDIADKLQNEIKAFLGGKNAIIGISGGIDSAVIAALCVKAVGKNKVIGVQMPYGNQSMKDGSILMNHFGIEDGFVDIKPIVDSFKDALFMIDDNRLVNGNIRARVRMNILYAFAGSANGMVIGTGNKTELMLGYFTKYGDGGCDVEPIGDLYKTEVFELAKYLGIPDCIINKPPSAELWEGQTDEVEIGMTYAEMDSILKGMYTQDTFVEGEELIRKYGEQKVDIIIKRVNESQHKRNMPKTFYVR